MGKQKGLNKEADKKKTLLAVMKKINSYWIEDFEAELGDDAVLFPSGMVWICEECMSIHVGFFLGASAELIGGMAIALSEYKDRLEFEEMPLFFDEGDEIVEGDEAYFEYGKSLMASVTHDDRATDIEIDVEDFEAVQEVKLNKGRRQ